MEAQLLTIVLFMSVWMQQISNPWRHWLFSLLMVSFLSWITESLENSRLHLEYIRILKCLVRSNFRSLLKWGQLSLEITLQRMWLSSSLFLLMCLVSLLEVTRLGLGLFTSISNQVMRSFGQLSHFKAWKNSFLFQSFLSEQQLNQQQEKRLGLLAWTLISTCSTFQESQWRA